MQLCEIKVKTWLHACTGYKFKFMQHQGNKSTQQPIVMLSLGLKHAY